MDELVEILGQSSSSEQLVNTTLKRFNEKNSTNFDITTPNDVKLRVSQVLLESINPLSSTATEWSPATVANCLTCLRIMCRGRPTLPILCSSDTLTVIASLGDIAVTEGKRRYDGTLSEEQVKVIVESVKCLCNIYLMNKHLVSGCGQLGVVAGVSHRLSLHNVLGLPHDLLYFDLRLLFLLTACDPETSCSCSSRKIDCQFFINKINILPPLGEVTGRPEEGNTLKSKLVRLMTAAGGHGAEDVVADLLFVLCKENTARLIKYTGYGNAAGLLMSRGLLGGTPSLGAGEYSSDDESSDTEEYIKSQDKVDEMTGGVMREGPSPLDTMTEEEKEQEAIKLNDLIHRLNSHGIIKMMPLTEQPPPSTDDRDSDSD